MKHTAIRRLAWPVIAANGMGEIFADAKIYSALGMDEFIGVAWSEWTGPLIELLQKGSLPDGRY
ncbi:MAG TPA: hypothetical protein VFS89_03255 [Nitrosospira sp.]|nr:hypothetical protein [Nitrosospira sp.]